MRRSNGVLLAFTVQALLCLATGCGQRPEAAIHQLSLQAADGVAVAATRYDAIAPSPPGLLLVHRLGAGAESWVPFARRAQQAGYMVVAFDLRGHGSSTTGPDGRFDYRNFSTSDWMDTLKDIDAARAALLEAGADPENLFIAGEALGASLALQYAVDTPDIQAALLLSPGLNYKSIDLVALLNQFETRPALLVWSEGDALAASSAATLQRSAPGHVEAHAYGGAAHGTDVFTLAPHAMGQAIVWLDQMRSAVESPPTTNQTDSRE